MTEGRAPFCHAIVANISDHLRGGRDPGRFYQGTASFAPSTRVYVGHIYHGEGGEHLHVIGLRRVSRRFVNRAVHVEMLDNLRIAAIYAPKVFKTLERFNGLIFDDSEDARPTLERLLNARQTYLRAEKLTRYRDP